VHVMIRWESGSAHLACDKQNAKMHREEESGASNEQSGRERCMTMSRVRGRDICGEQWGEESSAFVELCVHVMSRRARDVQRRAAVYGMSRVRGNDSCGEERGEGSSTCR
jgi:hypothetical protein